MSPAFRSLILGAFAFTLSPALSSAEAQAQRLELSAAELFAFADTALQQDDLDTAEAAFRALTNDPDMEIQTEARFRLAMLLASGRGQPEAAAVELRRILDDKPDAVRVHIELANILATIGDIAAAENELRRAKAGGLPPDVARFVEFYSQALRSQRTVDASIEVALAPDREINSGFRGTRVSHQCTFGKATGDTIIP